MTTKRAARVQRKYYNEKSRQTKFQEGQLVWLFWQQPPIRQRFKKLRKLWTGPLKIEAYSKSAHGQNQTRREEHKKLFTWIA